MKHLLALPLLLISPAIMASDSQSTEGNILAFERLFDNTGTVIDKITNNSGTHYGTYIDGLEVHVTFDCTADINKVFPMGIVIDTQQSLQYQANFMEPNFGMIQFEYAINGEGVNRIKHQGANDMMSSQDHLLKPDRLSRFNLPSRHSILNQVMHDRQEYLQSNLAEQASDNVTLMLPVSAKQDSIAVTFNPFHTSWLNAYKATCHNTI
jgi:hypothetical protein